MKLKVQNIAWLFAGALFLAGCDKGDAPDLVPGETAPEQAAVTEAGAEVTAAGAAIDLDDTNFTEKTATGVVLVDFWAPWCPPCRTQGPIIDAVAKTLGDKAKVCKVDVDKAPKTAEAFNIKSIPTLAILKDGVTVQTFTGVTQADKLVAAVEEAL